MTSETDAATGQSQHRCRERRWQRRLGMTRESARTILVLAGLLLCACACATVGCGRSDFGTDPSEFVRILERLPSWSPDGAQIAYVARADASSLKDWIWLLNTADKSRVRIVEGDAPAWSPDGTRLLFRRANAFRTLTLATGADTVICDATHAFYASWSPDGKSIVFDKTLPADSSGLWVVGANGGEHPIRLKGSVGRARTPAWAPDGKAIACAAYGTRTDLDIYVVELETGKVTRLAGEEGEDDTFPHWSPSGRAILYSTVRGEIRVVDVASRSVKVVASIAGRLSERQTGTWSPDGGRIAYSAARLHTVNADGSGDQPLSAVGE